jgi:sulfur carrier protein
MAGTIRINGEDKAMTACTVAELLRAEGVDPGARMLAVAVNGAVVARRDWPAALVAEGDRVEIVRPMQGG